MEENPNPVPSESAPVGGFVSGLLFIWDFLKVILIALIIILPIRYFVFQPFLVSGSSMEPNYHDGQYLIIDELSYRFRDPVRGEVLVLRPPQNQKDYYIKRIIGLPGEKIQIDNGRVTIYNNDHPQGLILDEPYLINQSITLPRNNTIVGGKNILTLGASEYFMMGDNREYSSDSREWGSLDKSEIVGRVLVRVLPITDFEFFSTPTYPNQ